MSALCNIAHVPRVFRIGTEPFAIRILKSDTHPSRRPRMGQAKPPRAIALIVEDDQMQREMIGCLLEESHFDVIECESAEAAEIVLQRRGGSLSLMMTDVHLAGNMDGVELAHIAKRCNPAIDV